MSQQCARQLVSKFMARPLFEPFFQQARRTWFGLGFDLRHSLATAAGGSACSTSKAAESAFEPSLPWSGSPIHFGIESAYSELPVLIAEMICEQICFEQGC